MVEIRGEEPCRPSYEHLYRPAQAGDMDAEYDRRAEMRRSRWAGF